MQNVLNTLLERSSQGVSSPNEVLLALSREFGVPPMPKYLTELERLLSEKNLLVDGTVAIAVRGRARVVPHIQFEDYDEWN